MGMVAKIAFFPVCNGDMTVVEVETRQKIRVGID